MKFGVLRGLANGHVFPEFGELWTTFSEKKIKQQTIYAHNKCTTQNILERRG